MIRELLEELGCEVAGIGMDPDGRFPRDPEPTAENLGELSKLVSESAADVGLAIDPDADRLSIVDEHVGLEERFRSRFVAIAIIVLMAGMPGSVPSYEMKDYDAGVSTESWPEELLFNTGNEVELDLLLGPRGVMPVSGWLQFRVEGAEPEEWRVNNSCSDSSEICRFNGLTQKENLELSLSITSPSTFHA